MGILTERLQIAAFPDDYAEILMEWLKITPTNFLSVKDVLYHFRDLDEDQAIKVTQEIVARITAAALERTYK